VEDWAGIRRRYRGEQVPIMAIVRRLGISRNAVRRALAAEHPPTYERSAKGALADAVAPQIRQLLSQSPTMPATVLAERVRWTYLFTVLKDRGASCGRYSWRRTRRRALPMSPAL